MSKQATGYYAMVDQLTETLNNNPSINTVSYGNVYEIMNNKTTLYPVGHFVVNNAELREHTFRFNMTLFCADIIDQTNDSVTDLVRGNNNEMDIHNTMLAAISDTMLMFRRKEAREGGYQLVGEPRLEAFTHRFHSDTAGWYCDFTVEATQAMGVGC